MPPRVLVDTDIVLDLLLARQPYFPAAARLFTWFQDGKIEGHVSSLAFSNLFYILRKAMSAADAVAALRKLRLIVRVVPVDEKVVELALASSLRDFEDAMQYYAALAQGVDALVSRNKRDYGEARIPVWSAEECLEFLSPRVS
jgi:predicted nucleic acid-binding protein